jgi:hypothetical protein
LPLVIQYSYGDGNYSGILDTFRLTGAPGEPPPPTQPVFVASDDVTRLMTGDVGSLAARFHPRLTPAERDRSSVGSARSPPRSPAVA